MCLLTWVMGVLSSTFWFIINLFIYLFFVVISAAGRKSTTKCILYAMTSRNNGGTCVLYAITPSTLETVFSEWSVRTLYSLVHKICGMICSIKPVLRDD
jgi:hypothetical protein